MHRPQIQSSRFPSYQIWRSLSLFLLWRAGRNSSGLRRWPWGPGLRSAAMLCFELCCGTDDTYFGSLELTKGSFAGFRLGVEPFGPDTAAAAGLGTGFTLAAAATGRVAGRQLAATAAADRARGIAGCIVHAAVGSCWCWCGWMTDLLPFQNIIINSIT